MEQDKINEYVNSVSATIKQAGHAVQFVSDDDKNIYYSYTIGLSQTTPYEIVLGGFTQETAIGILNVAVGYIRDKGIKLEQENDVDGICNVPLKLRRITNELGCKLCSILNILHPDSTTIEFYQLVWPDEKGVFPPNEECNKEFTSQQNLNSFIIEL